uniref:6-phosphofructo-2-kinase domain-containing protein n=1 Tax=Arcella intermedia TaxID=1963864 RepID=A0A6B2L3P3_9EUKA
MPARGKSYISHKLQHYLRWIGYNTRTFNVGSRRRKMNTDSGANFFDPKNKEKSQMRDTYAMDVLEDLIEFLKVDGDCAIHDATNSSKARRQMLLDRLNKEPNLHLQVLWVESICNDKELIEENIKLKLQSPDYVGRNPEDALRDFRERLAMYERSYEQLDDTDNDKSYIKLINVGRQVIASNIKGYLQSQIVTYLMNYNVVPRCIWVSRHGESLAHVQGGILGGDSELSKKGHLYAAALDKFFSIQKLEGCELWTSTLIRAKQTSRFLEEKVSKLVRLPALNEIYAGACEGMTYEQIREQMPDEWEARQKDKLRYRYPRGGESYMDLVGRLKPLIIELERKTETVFIISHQATLRTLISYWINCPQVKIPYVEVPFHTVLCLTPTPHGCSEVRYEIDLDSFQRGDAVFWTSKEIFYPTSSWHESDTREIEKSYKGMVEVSRPKY